MSLKDIIEQSEGRIVVIDATPGYKSKAAQEAQATGYGTKDYWDYLEEKSVEYAEKGIAPLDRSLSEALRGNEGL